MTEEPFKKPFVEALSLHIKRNKVFPLPAAISYSFLGGGVEKRFLGGWG